MKAPGDGDSGASDEDCKVVEVKYAKKPKMRNKWRIIGRGDCSRTRSRWNSINFCSFRGKRLVPNRNPTKVNKNASSSVTHPMPSQAVEKAVRNQEAQERPEEPTPVVRPLRDHPVDIPLERLDGYADFVDLSFVTDMTGPAEPAELPAPIQKLFDNLRAAYGIEQKDQPPE